MRHSMTKAERCELARQAFEAVFERFESFREDNVGADLAYLLGAILDHEHPTDSLVDWTREGYGETPPAILRVLREKFPKESALWRFILLADQTARLE